MMHDAIKNFNTQFEYEPKIENQENLPKVTKYIIAGMGGSHLAGDLIKQWNPDPSLDLIIHHNYGLPVLPEDTLRQSLLIASSYSGNTEEAIDACMQAQEKHIPVCVIASGGKLLSYAETNAIPYVRLPNPGIQPRSALGFSTKGLLKIMGLDSALEQAKALSWTLRPSDFENEGRTLAFKLMEHIPIIYASQKNEALAYNWKIKFNETGKIPAFYNTLPELNHNEMNGFDVVSITRELSKKMLFLFLKDISDDPRIIKRMAVLETIYRDRGLNIEIIECNGDNVLYKIFSSHLLADWTSYYIAEGYGLEAEKVPMVEEFKNLIK